MTAASSASRTCAYKPSLAWFTAIGGAWVFVLVTLGAFTTSIGAGMAFTDWPLSNGSINPEGWLENIAMFAEHSHRLSGTMMGLITLVTAVWLWKTESRAWLRQLGWWALVIVIIQGIIGGTRVLLDATHVPGFEMTLGQMLRIPHGVLAQVYICLLIAIAVGCSRSWIEGPARPFRASTRRLALACCFLLLVQLVIAATMRHNYAGLAIPTFPYSTPGGAWLPPAWNFHVGIHFAHRAMAVVLGVALIWFVIKLRLEKSTSLGMRLGTSLLMALLSVQIILGAKIIWTFREPHVTTGHVVGGALLLGLTFWLTCLVYRDQIEAKSSA